MSTFLDFLTHNPGFVDTKSNTFDVGGQFVQKLASYKEKVVNSFLRNNIDMNQTIAKIASDENLNDNQIHRVIEEANNHVFLYKHAQYQSNIDREVHFPIANLQTIKSIMEGKPVTASAVSTSLEKNASFEDDSSAELNSFNYSPYDMIGLSLEKEVTASEVVARELFNKYSEKKMDLEEKVAKFNASVYDFADALIAVDRLFANTEEIYKHACKESGLKIDKQQVVKIAINEKIASMKEDNALYDSYELRLDNVDTSEHEKQYSLGKKGFLKQAGDGKFKDFPKVETPAGKYLASVEDMVKLASEINNSLAAVESAKESLAHVELKMAR